MKSSSALPEFACDLCSNAAMLLLDLAGSTLKSSLLRRCASLPSADVLFSHSEIPRAPSKG